MGESMFGKRERLYAEARRLEAEKAANSERPAEKSVKENLTVVPPPEPLVPNPPRRPQAQTPPAPAPQRARPEGWKATASNALELGGIAMVSTGGFLISPWLGCIILGVLLIVLGVAIGYGA